MVDIAKQLRGFVYASCYGCSIEEGPFTTANSSPPANSYCAARTALS